MKRFRLPLSCLLLALATHWPAVAEVNRPLPLDILIVNGRVLDGSGEPAREVAIGVRGDRIVFVGAAEEALLRSARVIDAEGLLVTPGFIDPHTHSLQDLLAPERRLNLNYLAQGVTTVVVGNDGDGDYRIAQLARQLEAQPAGTNSAFLVGHNAVRSDVLGKSNRAPDEGELQLMRERVDSAMSEGALGLSSGLYYAPGSYADTAEVVALAQAAAAHGGLYETHLRDESSYNVGFIEALREALEIGRAAQLPVHIAHIKALGVDVWGDSTAAIELIEEARARGEKVTADQYPWAASGTHMRNAVMPRWALADSEERYQQRLQDPALEQDLRKAIADNIRRRGGPDSLLIATCAEQEYVGLTLAEIAQQRGVSAVDAALDILRTGNSRVISFNMTESDIEAFMARPWVMSSSDGNERHPRKYASFPRKYAHYVRERGVLTEAQFVHGSTGLTADTLGLGKRGYLRPGYYADILLFDPQRFRPQADYLHWDRLSEGVEYLLVNGTLAIDAAAVTGEAAGRPILRNDGE